MTRSALIIACPGEESDAKNYLPGTKVDLENYKNFLQSDYGGKWYSWEIETLINPTGREVKDAAGNMNSDYSFIVFTGHGGIRKEDEQGFIWLGDDLFPNVILKTQAQKQTIIFDSCRTVIEGHVKEFSKSILNELRAEQVIDARKIFDKHLSICEDGIVELYACSKNESARENAKDGGYYSNSLIKVGKSFGKSVQGRDEVLDLYDANSKAIVYMNENFLTIQSPEYNGGRRRNHFPFAVRNTML